MVEARFVCVDHDLDAVAELELHEDLLQWLRIVDSSRTSSAAISRFESPRATSCRTSRSRAVSLSSLARSASSGTGCWAMRSITRWVTDGESSESPWAIVWTAAMRSSERVRLRRKPEAPARSAPKT